MRVFPGTSRGLHLAETHLRLQVPVHDSHLVHEADGRHQALQQLAGLSLPKQLLPLDPLQQLAALKELHHQVGVVLRGDGGTLTVRTFISCGCERRGLPGAVPGPRRPRAA